MIKNLIFNKTKNASVRFFIHMSSVCVHLNFTAFDEAVLKLYTCTLVSALKSNMAAISMETNRGKKIVVCFFAIFFVLIIINIQWNDWVGKWAKQFIDQHSPSPLTCPWAWPPFCSRYKRGKMFSGLVTFSTPYLDASGSGIILTLSHSIYQGRWVTVALFSRVCLMGLLRMER